MNAVRSLRTGVLCLCISMVFSSSGRLHAQVESAQRFVETMIRDYFDAIESESLSSIEDNYHFTNDQAKEELLSQFTFAFDMADTKIEQVDISKVVLHDEQQTGVAFTHVKGVLTSSQTKESLTKEHHYAVILLRAEDRWRIAKVMRRADYDNAIRIAAEAGSSPENEQPQSVMTRGNSTAINPVADNYVYAYSYANWNDTNWGASGVISAGWHPAGGEKRSYLRFDLPGVDSIEGAMLKLYHYHTAGNGDLELGIHRVTSPWNEGVGTYPATIEAKPGDLTWNLQPTFSAEPTVRFRPTGKINQWIEIDVTPLVNDWLAGTPNYGMVIKPQGRLTGSTPECAYSFWSREYKDPGLWPILLLHRAGDAVPETETPASVMQSRPLLFDDFSRGAGQWDSAFATEVREGRLFWNDRGHRPLSSTVEIPIEGVVIEFDARCETDGLPIRWYNADQQGYCVTLGAFCNTRSASEFGGIARNIKWVTGKHLELKQWQHYKIVRYQDMLEAYVDGKKIISRKVPMRIEGKGPLRFYSYTPLGIDNVCVRVASPRNVMGD